MLSEIGWRHVTCARTLALALSVAVGACLAAEPRGRVMFWYDTEDYVTPEAMDCARYHANLLTEFGYRGNFALVGFYAQRLQERGRTDVIAALKRHCLGSQTLYHSRHPTICEYTDVADWSAAYGRCLAEEADACGRIKGVFGLDEINLFVPPGSSVTPVAMYAYADMGVKLYGAGSDIFGSRDLDRLVWYCNMLHVPYNCGGAADCKSVPDNDFFAKRRLTVIYTHPCQLATSDFWDGVNYRKGTNCPWRAWKPAPLLPPERQAANRKAWRDLMTRIKADPRLTVIDGDDLLKEMKPRVAIRRADAPMLLAAMERGLEPIERPASWSVSDVFQAAVAFLRGKEAYLPAKAWGFLEKPFGVAANVTLRKADLIQTAKAIRTDDFLPPQLDVGGTKVGPADFLIAALKVLATGADEVTVGPRDQIGPIAKHLPELEKLHLPGTWPIYSPDFKDRYVCDRLRWQFWTLRYEDSPEDAR